MSENINVLYGSATGIGSMPHGDPVQALELIKETLPCGPHWPQLSGRGRREGFLRQFLNLPAELGLIELEKGESPFFYDQANDWPEKVAKFYELYLQYQDNDSNILNDVLFRSAFPRENAAGFYQFLDEKWESLSCKPKYLKGQLSGPLSVGLQINAADGIPAFYREELRDLINKTLALIARLQVQSLKRFFLPVVIFIDEPLLLSYGQSPYISLSREHIVQSLEAVVMSIREAGAYVGVHSCSGGDWSILFQLPLHIVNFDAYGFLDSMLAYGEELEGFLRRGGCLGWGLVPTSEPIAQEDAFSLREKFHEGIRRLSRQGVSPDLLASQYLLTPSCGTWTLSVAQCEQVYRTTAELHTLLLSSV